MRMNLETVDSQSLVIPRLRGTELESQEDAYPCLFLTSWCPLTILHVLSFLFQTFSESGQGRISGPKQHVAVPRPEESLQKGKAPFTMSLMSDTQALSQKTQ